ncbi:hypothetical protein WDU94_010647 [Cyamophila willieti]
MSRALGNVRLWVILSCLCLTHANNKDKDCDNDGLSDHEKNVICAKAVNVNGFCCNGGPADQGCQEMASAVHGSNPKCSSNHLCTFTKGGKTIYITSKDDPKQNTVQDCMRSVRIIDKPGGGGDGDNDGDHKKGGGGDNDGDHKKGGGGDNDGDHKKGGGGDNNGDHKKGGGGDNKW